MKLILSLIMTVGVGALAGFITAGESSGEWYLSLEKPWFQPPSNLFGPVWTTLYILMGIAFYLVWKKPASPRRNKAIAMFLVQLVLNFFWSLIFFEWHLITWALVEIFLLWIAIIATIIMFSKVSKPAAWLLVPYLLWVTFASLLTGEIWRLN